MESYPEKIIMQWHITEKCNLHCLHCYRDDEIFEDPDISDLFRVLDRFMGFLEEGKAGNRKMKAHINIAGGEPLFRDDFYEFVSILSSMSRLFSFGILSNGTMIDRDMAGFLARSNVSFVQVSLDGMEETHDQLRGVGNFKAVSQALKNLYGAGVRTFVSFTASRMNYREFGKLADHCRKMKVSKFWADRMLPIGAGANLATSCLGPSETYEFVNEMAKARAKKGRFFKKRTEIAMDRALQFHSGGGYPYSCSAGDKLMAVMPDSSVYPCRRMPVRIGNLNDSSFSEIYFSEYFKSLRNRNLNVEGCEECFYRTLCRGGLKCLSYALKGTPFHKDPGCWL